VIIHINNPRDQAKTIMGKKRS